MTIDIRDEFNDNEGRFPNYDVYDLAQKAQLPKQKHLDLRAFQQENVIVQVSMLHMDLASMSVLNAYTMNSGSSSLEGNVIVQVGEQWTAGVVGKNPDRHNWRALELECDAGETTQTTSVIKQI